MLWFNPAHVLIPMNLMAHFSFSFNTSLSPFPSFFVLLLPSYNPFSYFPPRNLSVAHVSSQLPHYVVVLTLLCPFLSTHASLRKNCIIKSKQFWRITWKCYTTLSTFTTCCYAELLKE